nr:DUF4876 domain-containing protein [Prevotella sp.]
MKKILLTLFAALAITANVSAQNWNMVVTKADGSQVVIPASEVQNVSFSEATLEDKNVDQVVIKELYNGGCPKDAGSGAFQMDKGIVLYNNCSEQAVINNLCFAIGTPYNGQASNNNYTEDGELVYAAEGFIPAQNGIWYYPNSLVIEPYSQVVISCMSSIDNTQTYSQSVNYANADYYCMYDPESGYNLTSYYPTPADVIPTSHYLLAAKYGQGTAWMLSTTSPALFIYQNKQGTPAEYALNPDNLWYGVGEEQSPVNACIKVPVEWIIDGIEVFQTSKIADSKKRLTADVDGGYVGLTNKLGHTLYRNVDKEATEALAENSGKLVYDYALGVD